MLGPETATALSTKPAPKTLPSDASVPLGLPTRGTEIESDPTIEVLAKPQAATVETATIEMETIEAGETAGSPRSLDLYKYHIDHSPFSLAFVIITMIASTILMIFPIRGTYYTPSVMLVLCFLRLWELSGLCRARWPTINYSELDSHQIYEDQFEEEDAWHKGWCGCWPSFWTGLVFWALPCKIFGSLAIAIFLDWCFNGFRIMVLSDYVTPVPAVLIAILTEHFLSYTQHFSGHKIYFFWKFFHQLHHTPSRYNVWLSLWHHPWELVAFGCKHYAVSVFLYGLTHKELFWAVVIINSQGWLVHANIRTPWLLGFITARPEAHVIHHEEPWPRPAGFRRYNYTDCPIWDILFGTFYNPREDPREDPYLKIGYPLKTDLWTKQMFGLLNVKEMRAIEWNECNSDQADALWAVHADRSRFMRGDSETTIRMHGIDEKPDLDILEVSGPGLPTLDAVGASSYQSTGEPIPGKSASPGLPRLTPGPSSRYSKIGYTPRKYPKNALARTEPLLSSRQKELWSPREKRFEGIRLDLVDTVSKVLGRETF